MEEAQLTFDLTVTKILLKAKHDNLVYDLVPIKELDYAINFCDLAKVYDLKSKIICLNDELNVLLSKNEESMDLGLRRLIIRHGYENVRTISLFNLEASEENKKQINI